MGSVDLSPARLEPRGLARRRPPAIATAAVLVFALLLAACGAGGSSSPSPSLRWHECTGGQCATLSVPLDYNKPEGKTISLSLFRIRATDQKRRIGVLLFNPGGPGEPGIAFLRRFGSLVSDQLAARFDLVTWDPRGTGASDPVRCGPAFGRALDLPLPLPATAPERRAAAAAAVRLDQACERAAGPILGYVGTVNTARDLDRIRAALGARRLSYVGYSYGTDLGEVYANMFPHRVRAMVLDGVSDAGLSPASLLLAQARAIERSVDRFLTDCAANPRCAFHGDGHPAAAFDALQARIHARPLRVGKRLLGQSQFWGGVLAPLYTDQQEDLANSLAMAAHGNGAPLLKAYDELNERDSDGTYAELTQAAVAITCDDGLSVGPPAAVSRLESEFRSAAPRAGPYVLDGDLPCVYWPEKATPPRRPIRATGAAPLVVIGTTGDPVTPYSDAVHVAHELKSGVLLINKAVGHTADAGISGPCDSLVVLYLVRLAVPHNGTVCANVG